MKVKEESEIVDLKINIHKTKIMESGLITSWQIDGETMETVTDIIFLGSKITADGDCSHEIKRCLLLGRKAPTTLPSILKSRDITLPTKVCLVKAMVFAVVMYGCEMDYKESWAPKNWCFRYSNVSYKKFNSFYLKVNMSYYKLFPFIFASPEVLWDLQQKAEDVNVVHSCCHWSYT